ncbi:MAG: hypothetical protein KF729_24485 [Sandaracinaceae bacterium]|nr:hypothetical protein [Sandaracinaceae bacterium]
MTRVRLSLCVLLILAGCDGAGMTPPPGTDGGVLELMDGGGGPLPETDGGGPPPGTDGGTPPAGGSRPGAACDCDAECEGTAANPGVCVQGVCMTRATGTCSAAGSAAECPAGSRCWGLEGVTGGLCWPDCAAGSCAGTCDSDGSCVPNDSTSCNTSCAAICSDGGGGDGCPPNASRSSDGMSCVCNEGFVPNAERTACVRECTMDTDCGAGLVCVDNACRTPPCTATSCPSGTMCSASGECVIDIGTPPTGPAPADCRVGSRGVPDWRCTSDCARLVYFDPRRASGYWDYPLNGETEADQYRSWVRRDVMMLVRYATAMVACQSTGWAGNGGDLGLGDMSEQNGAIPGTREGSPGHPAGTHVNGHDMDIAYYQTGTSDNRLRSVCPHTSGGRDQYHCVGEPNYLDPWRTALFLGHLHATPNLRVIGVDGRVGPLVESAMSQLCAGGWITGTACTRHSVTYETTDMGRGWFRFHHHHLHVSIRG